MWYVTLFKCISSIHIHINKFVGGPNGQMPLWYKTKLCIQEIMEENAMVLHDSVTCLRLLKNFVSNIKNSEKLLKCFKEKCFNAYSNRFDAYKSLLTPKLEDELD